MTNNYQIIKSHLEYGHKVEVKSEELQTTEFFIGFFNDDLVNFKGDLSNKSRKLFNASDLIITPIPHRYKKLEVGTKVDVLKEFWLEIFGPYEVTEAVEDFATIMDTAGTLIRSVPLWAITPHVEEEELITKVYNELVEHVNLQSTNN